MSLNGLMTILIYAHSAASQNWIRAAHNRGNKHVIRGASWALASRTELRLSYRDSGNDGRIDLGFRIARYVDKPGSDL